MSPRKDNTLIMSCAAIAGVIALIAINAFVAVHFTDPFSKGAEIDMNNLASYMVSKSNLMYDDIPSATEQTDVSPSDGKLKYPEYPYFIEVDKTNQVMTVFTTSSSGRYDKPVRVMLCSVARNPKTYPAGYGTMKGSQSSAKNVWYSLRKTSEPVYAQYATQIAGDLYIHSVPYSDKKKDALDKKLYDKLGTEDSGGRILLTVENAKWISENCKTGTTVHITENRKNPSLTKALKEQIPKLDTSGWDPTDPDPQNPNYHPQYTEETPATEGYLTDNTGLKDIKYSKEL